MGKNIRGRSNQNKPQMPEKIAKLWLNHNTSQGNNWILQSNFDQIISHTGREYYHVSATGVTKKNLESCELTYKVLGHVYFTYMTDQLIISLIETTDGQCYLIYNTVDMIEEDDSQTNEEQNDEPQSSTIELTDEMINNMDMQDTNELKSVNDVPDLQQLQSIKSAIYYLENIKYALKCLTTKEQKLIGIKKWLSGKVSTKIRDQANVVNYLDFLNIENKELYLKLLNKFISAGGRLLDLTHNYSLTHELLNQVEINHDIQELALQQNMNINDFEWLNKFPNLKLINIWNCQQIKQEQLEQICSLKPDIEVLNIHLCCRLNLRALIPILRLKKLSKLCIDDSHFYCQIGIRELFIMPEEWRSIYCPTLNKLAFNSKNLSLDVIDYILIACPAIKHFFVDEDILKMASRNTTSGYDQDRELIFHSWQDPNKGFKIYRNPTFKNMYKNNYNQQLFSESMLKKIKEKRDREIEEEEERLAFEELQEKHHQDNDENNE